MNLEPPRSEPLSAVKPAMFWLMGALLFAGFFLTTGASYLVSRNSIRATILNSELPLTSDNIYSEIQRDLFEPILISSLMANDTFLKEWLIDGEKDVPRVIRYLGEIQAKYHTVTSFLVSDLTHTYYQADGVLKTVRAEDPADEWFFRVRDLAKPYEINVDPDMANQNAMTIFINYRMTGADGRFLAATGVGLEVSSVKKLIHTYRERYQREIHFYDREGNLVLHSGSHPEGDSAYHSGHVSRTEFREVLGQLSPEDATRSVVGRDGEMINFRYIPELDWVLVVEQTADGTRGILFQSFAVNLLICLITTVVLLSIIWVTLLRYQRSLEARNSELEERNAHIRQQAEDLARANQTLDAMHHEKDEFIGMTAHDLKNPLNAVYGFSEMLLLDETVRGPAREYAGHIHASSHTMLDHVEALLEMTELESDSFQLELGPVDASRVVEKILATARAQAAAKNLTFASADAPDPAWVLANEHGLARVVSNLLSNAIKYSPRGGTISFRIQTAADEVRIAIQDEGEGIAADEQLRLFEKFGRLSSRPTAGESSTGLGLYIVKQTMLRMGGRVWCESKKGAGATFTVALRPASEPASRPGHGGASPDGCG